MTTLERAERLVEKWAAERSLQLDVYDAYSLQRWIAAELLAVQEDCAKVADRNVYMSDTADEGGSYGGPSSCEYKCGVVIAQAIRGETT